MTYYIEYYNDQDGGGGRESIVRNFYQGSRYQRGHGVGSFLGGLLRLAIPYFKSGAKAIRKEALRAGVRIGDDVLNYRNTFKESLKERAKESGRNLQNKATAKLIDVMSGSGYKAVGGREKRQSSRKRGRKRSTLKRKNNKGSVKKRKIKYKKTRNSKKRKIQKLRSITDIFRPKR